jgi:hypothetical protein
MPIRILCVYRVVVTIGKHVIAQDSLPGGNKGVGVDKSAPGGIVVAALEII